MKKENSHPDDVKLGALLHTARISPSLPPRFQQNVWRRIENAEAPVQSESRIEALVSWILRPRLAFASVTILMLAGILLGAQQGAKAARQDAQARYIASVSPHATR